MRNINTEVNALRMEYPNADRRRQNEIFESLSHYANRVCENVYNNLKRKYGNVFTYDECLMTAYEKLHRVLLNGMNCFDLYDAIYRACYKDLEKQHLDLVAEQETLAKLELDVPAVEDEEMWDEVNEGRRIWEDLSKYYNNEKRKKVFALYFGFDGENPHSQVEVARRLNMSRQRVKYIICEHSLKEALKVVNINKKGLEALNLFNKNIYTLKQIALKTGLKPSQITSLVKKQKLKNITENE